MGDLNARHTSWNCVKNNTAGNRLYELQNRSHFLIHNTPSPTHFPHSGKTPSTIDLLLTNTSLYIPQIFTLENVLTSDHMPIICEILGNLPRAPLKEIPNYKQANWTAFQRFIELGTNLEDLLITIDDIDAAVARFNKLIIDARTHAVPMSKQKDPKNDISHEARTQIQERNRLMRIRQRCTNSLAKAAWKTQINRLNKQIDVIIQKDRNKNWQNSLSNLPTGGKKFWHINRNIRGKNGPVAAKFIVGDNTLSSPEEKVEALAESFERAHQSTFDPHHPINVKVNNFIRSFVPTNDDNFCEMTSEEEINGIISKIKPLKAPGPDGIQNILLKKLPSRAISYIAILFNKCIKLGYWPNDFRQAKVVPIPKPGKNHTDPSNYRPISLLNALGKILEKILQTRINLFADQNHIISPTQFGFRSQHSSIHQVKRVTNFITENKAERRSTGLLLMDIEKAFDTVWHDGLIYKLNMFGFPPYIITLINSFVRNRSFAVNLQDTSSSPKNIINGLAQGSCLSPILYSIYISDLKLPACVESALYADDTGIYAAANRSNTIVKSLQRALNNIDNYFKKWRIKINASKTQAIIFPFNSQKKRIPTIQLNLDNNIIEFTKTVTYLGTVLDSKLNFAEHTRVTRDKATKCFRAMYPLLSRRSLLSTKNKLLIYNAIFVPIITYGAPVWRNVARTHLGPTQVLMNKIQKCIHGLHRRFPTNILQRRFGHRPLTSILNNISDNFYSKCQNSNFNLIREMGSF